MKLPVSDWVKRNKLAGSVIGLAFVIILIMIGSGIYHAVAPANDMLPSTPSGWTRLATISASQSSEQQVNFRGVQLQICWVVKGGSVVSLSYEIGTPSNGATTLYGANGSQNSSGCVYDPGNDNGVETFAVIESGLGNYAVSLNEQLTPSQEAALNKQEAQQAAQQAQQEEAQAVAQAKATAEGSVDQAAQSVASDFSNATSDTASVNSVISSVNAALQQEQTDLASTKAASASVVSGGNNSASGGPSCSNADNVQSDADNVQSNADNVQSALDNVPDDLASLQKDVSSLRSDQTTYLSIAGSVSGYTSTYAPSLKSIASAEAAAQAALTLGTSVNAAGMTSANQLVSQANTAAQVANSAGC